ncbi:MAG: hypothetical protein IJI36_01555 [Kiritimatiellae bacterium]|nr:hypothetical protein [Kiritimatiellia bacterium]
MREVSSAEGNVERAIRANDVDTLKNVRRCLEKGLAAARKVADVAVKLALYSTPGGGGLVALRDIAKSAGKHTLKIGVTKAVDATESKALQGVYETISKVGRIGTFSVEDIDKLKSIEGLYEERWKMGTIQDRAASLMQLEVQLAQIQGRPPVELVFERMGKNEAGFFDGKQLHVNFEHISNPDYRLEVIDTIGHEGCHAYQEWAITHPGFHPNDAEVKYWAANRLAYFQPKYIGEKFGVEYYRNQPMELHAWPYGRQVQDIYFSPKKPFASFEEMMPDYLRAGITKVQSAHKGVSLGEHIANIKERIENYVQSQLENPKVRHKLKRGMMKLAVKGIQKGLKWWERNGMTITSEAKTIVRAMGKKW